MGKLGLRSQLNGDSNMNHSQGEPVEVDGRFSGMHHEYALNHYGMKAVVVDNMTPPFAERLLGKLHPNQRNPKLGKIAVFASDMRAGRWRLSHEGPALDEDGFLIDGRNRLLAVLRVKEEIASGKVKVPMLLFYGVPRLSLPVVNTGTSRNVNDAATISGMNVSLSFTGVVRRLVLGLSRNSKSISTQESLDALHSYSEAIGFTFVHCTKSQGKGIVTAPVRATVARAYYSVVTKERDRLGQFLKDLVTGLPENSRTDSASITFRNWMLSSARVVNRESKKSMTHYSQRDAYGYCCYALSNYLARKSIAQLVIPSDELFLLPDMGRFDEKEVGS